METNIHTEFYNFQISLEEIDEGYAFEINAFCNIEKTKSCITSMNFILSYCVIDYVKQEDYDSTIYTNQSKGQMMYKNASALFSNTDWLNRLFHALQDDRMAGEWEA